MEIVVTIALIGILACIGFMSVSSTRISVGSTKLRTDVVRLNQIISTYLGDGGSFDGTSTAQSVIDKLKTVRTNADAKRQVGAITGRGVDVRLTARMQTADEKNTTDARAVWNTTTKRFDIVTTRGVAGISDFVLDDNLLTTNYPTETRTRTTMLYNDANGWVWSSGNYSGAAFLNPANATLAIQENVFDPTVVPPSTTTSASTTSGSTTSGSTTSGSTTSGSTTSGSTTSGSTTSGSTTSGSTTSGSTTSGSTTSGSTTSGSTTSTALVTLPKPINTPNGGTYSAASWPTTITINSNGAPVGSTLKYRINSGTWINYTTGFTINSGDKVESKNFSNLPLVYSDSSTDSDTYYKLVPSFTGTSVPTWANVNGGPNVDYTIRNNDPSSVVLSHGDTRLDLGGGEYLDAGVENTLTYNRVSPFSNVQPNTDFSLGEFIILNGTTFNDSEATSATLNIALNLTQPITQSGTVALNLTMVSTANTSDRLASADTVTLNNPTTSFVVTTGGVSYTLQVRMVSLEPDNGVVTGNTFYIYEGASARASLVGKFVSNR